MTSLRTLIENSRYYSNEGFRDEGEKIFHNSWIYAGLTSEFKEINDYKVFESFGKSIIIQKSEHGFNAFFNTCAHRHSQIFLEKRGNSPLVCKYHGWRYTSEGRLSIVPSKNDMHLSEDQFNCIKLEKVHISLSGKFIFINLDKIPERNLQDYLGEMNETLLKISEALGEKIESNTVEFNANWKLVIENTLEAYHINTVHENSFAMLGISQTSPYTVQIFDDHSTFTLESKTANSSLEKMAKLYRSSHFTPTGFFHALIFPNLLIGSTYGLTFFIGTAAPDAPDKCQYQYDLYYSSKCPNSHAVKTTIGYTASEFTNNFLNEDK
jgi:phenylpropionate dioxygenase-like ring-hydroxylating dioxygenase large terminal subunit